MEEKVQPASLSSNLVQQHEVIEEKTAVEPNSSLKSSPLEAEETCGADVAAGDGSNTYLTGWRLSLTSIGVLLCLYLVNIEVTIVSTSLVTITDDLLSFDKTSWVVTGYLIAYTGFVIIWSKLSDIVGRKSAIIASMLIFVAFSGGCGGAQTIVQLIICRAFQGIGAAGGYSLAILTVYDMVPKAKLAVYGGMISVTIALATLSGPIFGGLISGHGSWRWVFYLNLPLGFLSIALLLIAIPNDFGSTSTNSKSFSIKDIFTRSSLQRIDLTGAGLLLAGSLLLVTALVEASTEFAWSSGVIIALLVLSAVSWLAFLTWEWHISKANGIQEPIFPWRFFSNRPWMGMLLTTFFVGVPFNVLTVSLPQRFQALSGTSALGAGIRLIPYSTTAALGSAIANRVVDTPLEANVPPIYLLFLGAALHVVGLSLLLTLPQSGPFPAAGYGYEVLAGAGVGVTFGILILATPFVVEARDLAVATGAIIQFRFLGGAIGLAIASTILNSMLKSDLRDVLTAPELSALLQSSEVIQKLPLDLQEQVKRVFARSYDIQFKIMIAFVAVQFPAAALLWRRKGNLRTAG